MLELRLKPWVSVQLRELPERIHKETAEILLDLREEPYPPDSLAMFDEHTGFWRIRVDGYRIVYTVREGAVVIWMVEPRTARTYNSLVP